MRALPVSAPLALVLAAASCGAVPAPAVAPARVELGGTAAPEPARPRAEPQPPVRVLAAASPSLGDAARPEPARSPRFAEPIAPRTTTRAIVLLYHNFDRGGQALSMRTRDFEAQLDWLEANHVEIVSVSELVAFLRGRLELPARVAVITIDDGYKSVYESAWPILARRRVRFTIGLPTGMIEHPRNAPVMTWDQINEMIASGLCEVASHGHMHRRLPNLGVKLQKEELELSRDLIVEHTGKAPVAYFYPLGAFDPVVARAVQKAGYPAAFRASGAPVAAGSGSPLWLPRMTLFHGETDFTVARYFSEKVLASVGYDEKRDRAARD